MTADPVRVFAVDDHVIVRDGIRALVESTSGFRFVGEAGTANDGLRGLLDMRPDVAIVDVRMPGGDGIEMVREALSRGVGTRFIVFTSFPMSDAYYHAIMAGASGFLAKDACRERVLETLRAVAAGEEVLDTSVFEQDDEADTSSAGLLLADLSERERAILDLIADGRTNREIAEELFLAEKTVRNYVSGLLAKLGMKNRTEVATYVVRLVTRRQAGRAVERSWSPVAESGDGA